jgi:hypothetical protein
MITEAAKLRERIRRPDFGQLKIEVTVDDRKAYTKAWTSLQLDQVFDNAPSIRVARFCEVCADPVGRDYQLTRGAERKRRASNDWFSNNAYGPRP